MILKCIKTVATVAFAMVSINVAGQDLLARQAPIDRKLKAVDSLALVRQIKAEQAVYPAYSLYPTWENQRVHAYGNTVSVPDTFRIDLSGFCMPTTHTKITSKCGPRWRRMHNGLDIKVYIGDTIRAAFDGRVRMVKYERRGYGKYVVIRHDNGLETYYGHLSERLVQSGEWVEAGQIIGLGGSTGRSTGPHLHFETRYYGQAFDPERLIDFESGILRRQTFLLKKSFFDIRSNAGQDFDDEAEVEKADKKEAAERAAVTYHTIKSGDTLGALARRYGTTVSKLCSLNGIKSTTILRLGRKLRVR